MTILRDELVTFLDNLLKPSQFKDFAPNGLQVEGRVGISRIVCGVTASQALVDYAVEKKADAIIVHHGYFWTGETPVIKGMKRNRLKALLENDINLIAYHLPLDAHPEYGNNATLADLLDIQEREGLEAELGKAICFKGALPSHATPEQFKAVIEQALGRSVLLEKVSDKPIQTLAWCTGGGQHYIEQAAANGIDAFITGEVSEKTIHIAREMGIHFYACGHHATERYGVAALANLLAHTFEVDVLMKDIDNPA